MDRPGDNVEIGCGTKLAIADKESRYDAVDLKR
jgi:hypothetical protein